MGLAQIISLKEWDCRCESGEAHEDDLKNGDPRFIPIECPTPKCRAKLEDKYKGTTKAKVKCGVCLWWGWRKLGKMD